MPASLPSDRLERLVRGALGFERSSSGVLPLRLPEHAFAQMPLPFTRETFRMPSGVRLAFTTEATSLELDAAVSDARLGDPALPEIPAVFDLALDGDLHASVAYAGEALRFDGLPAGRKDVELWLPPNAAVELRELRADAPLRSIEERRPRWLHYGSSISHCAEARRPTEVWPVLAARLAGLDVVNLGVAGSCHLDQFVARAIRDEPAACISLKVGVNIIGAATFTYRSFVPAVHGFLDTIRDGHPDTPILVVSPVICPSVEHAPAGEVAEDALTFERVRSTLEEIVGARAAGGEELHYLDGLRLFGEPDAADLPDGLHPSPDGYICIGERFADAVFRRGCFSSIVAGAREGVEA